MRISEQLRLLKASKHVHTEWYRQTYPEVADLNMDSALHYLRYGAAMGRNPGKNFDTQFYLENYPDAVESGMNPLLHYVLHGQAKGYVTRLPTSFGKKSVAMLRTKLLSLGFTQRPLAELEDIQKNSGVSETRALAARELGLWYMRLKTKEGYEQALIHLKAARADAPDLLFRRKLTVAELLCHYFLGNEADGRACYECAALAGEICPDIFLAMANFESSSEARVALMNRALQHYNISPIALLPSKTLALYDRLTSAVPLNVVENGPKVTVLIAAYDAAGTLPTALRSLQEQTWKNLEILVLDDCSPSSETAEVAELFAADDPRIRVIRMKQNGGAYVARNRGLDEATGVYVTLHDADDWSHPKKIETQVHYLINNPEIVGCLSEQARVSSDLTYNRWAGYGGFIIPNISSFMFNKTKMKESAGYWDTVRFSADSELIRRLRAIYGKDAIKDIPTGPLSFQRDSSTSIIADAFMGINGFFFGARKEYLDAQNYFRNSHPERLHYSGSQSARPFPAPNLMLPERKQAQESQQGLDVVLAADLRGSGRMTNAVLEELARLRKGSDKIGIFEMNSYCNADAPAAPSHMTREAREAIWKANARILTFGENVICQRLIIWSPIVLQEHQRYLPTVRPETISIIVDDPALLSHDANGLLECAISRADKMTRLYFDCKALWIPTGSEIRALLSNASKTLDINISAVDWPIASKMD